MPDQQQPRLAVVIPCYCVAEHLAGVLKRIGPEVSAVYCVIDACPKGSEAVARGAASADNRIRVIVLEQNQGVGGAFRAGVLAALDDGYEIVVKLDGDDQMDPADIPQLIEPIIRGQADYTKGNRFFHLDDLKGMPLLRLIGNAGVSFLSKFSSGYWNILDPSNGFLAIHRRAALEIPWQKIQPRYFFESDLLFRLSIARAVVVDVPITARYAGQLSHLSIVQTLFEFPWRYMQNLIKRIFYCYFLREFHIASVNLLIGLVFIGFGVAFGGYRWIQGAQLNQLASAGTVMFAALPVILGWQALLSFLNFDVSNIPKKPISH